MKARGKYSLFVVLVLGSGLFAQCVGDDNVIPTDAGNDVTTTDVANDTTITDSAPPTDAADAADVTDASSTTSHLYVTNFANGSGPGGALLVFDLPITSASKPSVVLTTGLVGPSDVEVMPNQAQIIVVDRGAQRLLIYDLPITSTSAAVQVINTVGLSPEDGAFDSTGAFWVGGLNGLVYKFPSPLTSTTTPTVIFKIPNGNAFAVAVNKNDGVLVGGYGGGGVYLYNTPITDASTPSVTNTAITSPTGIALATNDIYVSNFNGGSVGDFAVPIGNATTPTVISGAGDITSPERLKYNAQSQTLTIADGAQGLVVLGGANFTDASVHIPNGAADAAVHDLHGVVYGP